MQTPSRIRWVASSVAPASPGGTANASGLNQVLATCKAGDTLMVTEFDRLARSLLDARDIAEDLTKRK